MSQTQSVEPSTDSPEGPPHVQGETPPWATGGHSQEAGLGSLFIKFVLVLAVVLVVYFGAVRFLSPTSTLGKGHGKETPAQPPVVTSEPDEARAEERPGTAFPEAVGPRGDPGTKEMPPKQLRLPPAFEESRPAPPSQTREETSRRNATKDSCIEEQTGGETLQERSQQHSDKSEPQDQAPVVLSMDTTQDSSTEAKTYGESFQERSQQHSDKSKPQDQGPVATPREKARKIEPYPTVEDSRKYEVEYQKLSELEEIWRKSPPRGFFVLELLKKYGRLAENPLPKDTAERVSANVVRLQDDVVAANVLFKDLKRKEDQFRQAIREDPWLVPLMSECQQGIDKHRGTPAWPHLCTQLEKWKDHNDSARKQLQEVKKEESELRKNNRLNLLRNRYRSIAGQYHGTEAGSEAYKCWKRLEDELR